MTSKAVNNLHVVTSSELRALLKLAQRVNEIPILKDRWKNDCMVAFDWTDEAADHILNQVRRLAVRELPNVD